MPAKTSLPGSKRARRPAKTAAAGLKDVAASAGVSTATVSRVINGSAAVSEEVRARVQKAGALLGYIPNGVARALSSRQTRTIGAVVPTIEHDGFARTVFTLQKTLQAAGWTLLLANSDYNAEIELQAVTRLLSQGIDGLMLIGGVHHAQLLPHLAAKRIPVVEAWTLSPDAPSVGFDNARAAAMLTDYLLDLGHRRIAIVAGHIELNDRAAARVLGVRQSLQKRGLTTHAEWLTQQPYRILEGIKAARDLLADPARAPTAIICGNDQLALGVLVEARTRQIEIPAALSVAGFGDSDYAEFLDPPLTTLHVPAEEIGNRAAHYLLECIAGETPEPATTVDVRLVIRATTAPPARPSPSE